MDYIRLWHVLFRIRKTGIIPDDRDNVTTVYEAGGTLFLSPI
jgi:hypothetical protein